MRKRKQIYKWTIASTAVAGFLGVISYGAFALYEYSQQQAINNFIDTFKTDVSNFFDQSEEPEVRVVKKTIAGEDGFSVNKGPIRIESAYQAIFDEKSLKSLADWVYQNVPWGANGISLNTITFTTGIDSNINSFTLGYHTSDREGSSIYLSPDAFEKGYATMDLVFEDVVNDLLKTYFSRDNIVPGDTNSPLVGSFPEAARQLTSKIGGISADLDRKLLVQFNGVDFSGLGTAKYRTINSDEYQKVWTEILEEVNSDNFFTVNSPLGSVVNLEQITNSTIWGDGLLTDPARLTLARERNKLRELINQFESRLATISAWKLLQASTDGFANVFIRTIMQDTFFEEQEVFADGSKTYQVIPRDRWDSAWDRYSSTLTDGGVAPAGIAQRKYVFDLFKEYYDLAIKAMNEPVSNNNGAPTLEEIIFSYLNDNASFNNLLFRRITNTYENPGDKIKWVLQGKLRDTLRLSTLASDRFLLLETEAEVLKRKSYTDRYLTIDYEKHFLESLNAASFVRGKEYLSLAQAYRNDIIEMMKYTISHEYGHHETLWQTSGNYDKTFFTYGDQKYGAKYLSPINASLFDKLDAIANNSAGIKNVIEVVKRSNDKFTSTWTPSVYSSGLFGYTPVGDYKGWSSKEYGLRQLNISRVNNALDYGGGYSLVDRQISLPIIQTEQGADSYSYSGVTQNTTPSNSGKVNAYGVTSTMYYIDVSRLSPSHPFRIAEKAALNSGIGNSFDTVFSKFSTAISLSTLLQSYQQTKWISSGRTQDSPWAVANNIKLYNIPSRLLTGPTIKYAALEFGDANDPFYIDLKTVLSLYFNLSTSESNEVVALLEEQIGELYDSLVNSYPNMFESYGTLPKMSDYKRDLLITKRTVESTKTELATKFAERKNIGRFGIYFNPDTTAYRMYRDLEGEDEYWNEHNKNTFVTDGTISAAGSQGVNGFLDYTGSYAEFLTRFWNQLTFRPDYNKYIDEVNEEGIITKTFNSSRAYMFNNDWYQDMNRFIALGMPIYNYKVNTISSIKGLEPDPATYSMTDDGAKLLIWAIEMLGVHSNLDLTKPLPHTDPGLIDFNAIQKSLVSANVLEKVYKNRSSDQYTMWGWLTPEQAAKYKYVAIKNTKNDQYVFKQIYTKNTSNYFFYEDMSNTKRRNLIEGFVQWTSEWFVAGDFSNADLVSGEYELFFAAEPEIAKVEKLITSNFQDQTAVVTRNNNDYAKIFTKVEATIDPIKRRVTFKVGGANAK